MNIETILESPKEIVTVPNKVELPSRAEAFAQFCRTRKALMTVALASLTTGAFIALSTPKVFAETIPDGFDPEEVEPSSNKPKPVIADPNSNNSNPSQPKSLELRQDSNFPAIKIPVSTSGLSSSINVQGDTKNTVVEFGASVPLGNDVGVEAGLRVGYGEQGNSNNYQLKINLNPGGFTPRISIDEVKIRAERACQDLVRTEINQVYGGDYQKLPIEERKNIYLNSINACIGKYTFKK